MRLGFLGLMYGLGLTVVGVFMAGAGHGTYLLLCVAAAPVSFLGPLFCIAGPPVFWTVMGFLLSHATETPQRQILVCLMLLHYLGVLLLPFFGDYVEGNYFEKVWLANPEIVLVGGSLYLAGQLATWVYWFKASTRFNN